MNKKEFLETLKRAIKYPLKKRSVPCRCSDCCNEKQNRQYKTANAVLK